MSTQTTKTAKRPTKAAARTAKALKARQGRAQRCENRARHRQEGGRNQAQPGRQGCRDRAHADGCRPLVKVRSSQRCTEDDREPPVQPAAPEMVLKTTSIKSRGRLFTSPTFGRAAASGTYTVVKLLAVESDDYQYRSEFRRGLRARGQESQLDKM